MYMDQQSNIVDLNRGRFSYVYDFFDGLAAVIDKNTGKVGYIDKTGALTDQPAFQDKAQISDWAVEWVGKLAANAIMNGTSQSTASPKQSCTVEQSILLLYRLYQKV